VLHEFHKFYSDVAQPNTLGADLYMAEEVEHLLSINDSGNSELFPVYYINCFRVINIVFHVNLMKLFTELSCMC